MFFVSFLSDWFIVDDVGDFVYEVVLYDFDGDIYCVDVVRVCVFGLFCGVRLYFCCDLGRL